MQIQFEKKVGQTISKGQITIPKEKESYLDKNLKLPVGESMPVKYKMPNGTNLLGKLYQSENKWTTYYQFYLPNQDDKKLFKQKIGAAKEISCTFDISNHLLNIILV